MPRLLSIDDDRSIHHLVRRVLEPTEVEVVTAATATEGLEAVATERPDVVLLDIVLPDMSGLDAFDLIRKRDPHLPVILATAEGGSETAIEAMKRGAFDYLTKPIDALVLERLVADAVKSRQFSTVEVGLNEIIGPKQGADPLIGHCAAMQEVFKAIGRVAPQDVAVLIRGESGTGKELVARALFHHGSRAKQPLLAVNCAALADTLLESELFGHEKGAFTGAESRRIGKFEQCDRGTLFLDEVGDMSSQVQAKVLRLLQEQSFERLGGTETIKTDVRVVSATNRDLEAMCDAGDFRPDLFYRLNGYTIALPPLRERGDDRVTLLRHFLACHNQAMRMDVQGISPQAMQRLLAYDWPGNVREMQSVIKHAMLDCQGPVLMESSLPAEINPTAVAARATAGVTQQREGPADDYESSSGSPHDPVSAGSISQFVADSLANGADDLYAQVLALVEKQVLTQVLTHTGGNQSEAARRLGITRGSLRNKIRSNGIVIEQDVSVQD